MGRGMTARPSSQQAALELEVAVRVEDQALRPQPRSRRRRPAALIAGRSRRCRRRPGGGSGGLQEGEETLLGRG